MIQDELKSHPDTKMIVVDTFAKIRDHPETDYNKEYSESTKFHELGLKYHLLIVLVTHVIKKYDRNNIFTSIYGSAGLQAGADSTLVMIPSLASKKIKELFVTGKDIPDNQYSFLTNENMIFTRIETEIEEDIDQEISKICNFVIRKGKFAGTVTDLKGKLDLQSSPKAIGKKLNRYKDYFASCCIKFKKYKKSDARVIGLVYNGGSDLMDILLEEMK